MPDITEQMTLFDLPEWWEEEWRGMPEFIQEDQTPFATINVHFATPEDIEIFSALVRQRITRLTQSIWFPKAEIKRYAGKRYVTEGYNE